MWPARLSPHFTLQELTQSAKAAALIIANDPPEALLPNALRLANLAEIVRDLLGKSAGREVSMTVTSGYRSLGLNSAVGGSGRNPGEKLSAHVEFRAMDFLVQGTNLATAFEVIRKSATPFDKLIFEIDSRGAAWLHLQVEREGAVPARRVLRGMKGAVSSSYRELLND